MLITFLPYCTWNTYKWNLLCQSNNAHIKHKMNAHMKQIINMKTTQYFEKEQVELKLGKIKGVDA